MCYTFAMAYKTGNPALNKKTFSSLPHVKITSPMTLDGVALKSVWLLIVCLATGFIGWQIPTRYPEATAFMMLVGPIAVLVIGFITILNKRLAVITAQLFAVVEGVLLGALSAMFESVYPGIVVQALLLTATIFLAMLFIYLARLIRPTENFKLGVASATLGVFCYYFVAWVGGLLGFNFPLIHSNSLWGIGFTLAIIVLAALNLVLDFDFIESGVKQKAPKYMEWYASFGLMVTLIWLYLELLRLLAKLKGR